MEIDSERGHAVDPLNVGGGKEKHYYHYIYINYKISKGKKKQPKQQ